MAISESTQQTIAGACRVGVWVFSLIAFAVLASDKNDHGWHYSQWTALRFAVGIGVLTWLHSSFILVSDVLSRFGNLELLSAERMEALKTYGDMAFAFLTYTAVICLSTFSTNFSDADTTDGRVDKLNAACIFTWFQVACYGPLVYWSEARDQSETMPSNTGSYSPVDLPPSGSAYPSHAYSDEALAFGDGGAAPSADV